MTLLKFSSVFSFMGNYRFSNTAMRLSRICSLARTYNHLIILTIHWHVPEKEPLLTDLMVLLPVAVCNLVFLSCFTFFFLDIDECESSAAKCDLNADCFNSPGSYQCRCRLGYRGNGTQCVCEYCSEEKANDKLWFPLIISLDSLGLFYSANNFFSSAADGTCDGVACDQHGACVPKTARGRDRQCVCVTGWKGDGRSCEGSWILHLCHTAFLKFILRFNKKLTQMAAVCFYLWTKLQSFLATLSPSAAPFLGAASYGVFEYKTGTTVSAGITFLWTQKTRRWAPTHLTFFHSALIIAVYLP